MSFGKLYVVSGPSGAGKSTVCRIVRERLRINLSISATSRAPRDGEIDGEHYYFLSEAEFLQKINNNEFIEYANVHGNYYGTLKSEVESKLNKGEKVILEIDVQGGLQVKKSFPEAKLIFFKTLNKEILAKRLINRKTESQEEIDKRLKNALKELEYENMYDVTIINNDLEKSCSELINIIEKED